MKKIIFLTGFAALSAMIMISCGGTKQDEQKQTEQAVKTDSTKAVYSCEMHPEVTSDKPGTCPKCGMDLIEKK